MALKQENIIVGAATVYVSKLQAGEAGFDAVALPTAVAGKNLDAQMAEASPTGGIDDWRHLGLTSGGVSVTWSPNFLEVDVDQFIDTALFHKQGNQLSVSTQLAESTLENMILAWGLSSDDLDDSDADNVEVDISGGALGDSVIERKLAFAGPAPRGDGTKERRYILHRAISIEAVTTAMSKTEASMVPINFRCLPSGNLAGKVSYGTLSEVVI